MRTAVISTVGLFLIGAIATFMPSQAAAAPENATSRPAASVRDLIAQGAGDQGVWLTFVQPDPELKSGGMQSVIRFRGRKEHWAEVGRISGRVTANAIRGSQLAVLQDTGEWLLIGTSGSIVGPPLPGDSRIRSLASDGETLWAVGAVAGELPATAPATRSTTRTAAASAPVTSTRPALPVLERPDTRLMLFRLEQYGWQAVGRLNAPVDAEVAITIARGTAWIAAKSGGFIQIFNETTKVGDVRPTATDQFNLLSGEGNPLLWSAGISDAGEIRQVGRDIAAVPLLAPAGFGNTSDRAVAIATGRLRLFYTRMENGKEQVCEQMYDLTSFQPIDKPAVLKFPTLAAESKIQAMLMPIVLAAIVFAMIASFQHRRTVRELLETEDRPQPAPLLSRLLGGLIDGVPAIAVLFISGFFISLEGDFNATMQDPIAEIMALVAVGVHLLFTTTTELIWGRTVGKMVMGLSVITLDGNKPTAGAIVLRNLLRIIEIFMFPLVGLMILSPLRQRAGDIAVGTMVISNKPPESKPDESSPST